MQLSPPHMETTQSLSHRFSRMLAPLRSRVGVFGWGFLIVFLIQRGTDVANLVTKLFLGRVLEPLDFGAVEPIGATVAMLSLPAAVIYGASVKSISRLRSQGQEAQCRALIRDLQIVATIGSLSSIVIVFILRNFILTRLHLDSTFFIWMIALMFAMAWWAPLVSAIIRAEHDYKLLALKKWVSPLLMVALTIALVGLMDYGLSGAIAARAFSSLFILVILFIVIYRHHKGEKTSYHEERTRLFLMILPMFIYVLSSSLAMHFDRLYVRNFLVNDSYGLSAIFMLGQIPRLAIAPLIFVLFPLASAEHASGRQLGRLLKRAVVVTAAITAICCLLFSYVGTPLLNLWRPEFAPYGQYVWIYALMTGLQSLNKVFAQVELARHEYRFLWLYALPVIISCLAIYLLRNFTPVRFSLPQVLWFLTAGQAVTSLTIIAYIRIRPTRPPA